MAIVISAVGAQFKYLDSKMATGKIKGICRPSLENVCNFSLLLIFVSPQRR